MKRSRNSTPKNAPQQGQASSMRTHVAINDISPLITNAEIVGLVLRKLDATEFVDKKTNQAKKKGSFIIRDRTDTCAVICWGDAAVFAAAVEVGDVVTIKGPSIKVKNGFSSPSTSNFELHLDSLEKSSVEACTNSRAIAELMLTKPPQNSRFVTLDNLPDITESSNITVMVMVNKILDPQLITTKKGDSVLKQTVITFDQYCHHFPIIFWGADLKLVESLDNDSILFLENIKYSVFQDRPQGVFQKSSTLMLNPETAEAIDLFKWATREENFRLLEESSLMASYNTTGSGSKVDKTIADIQDFYFIENLKLNAAASNDAIHGFVYASLYAIELNGNDCCYLACSVCKKRITELNLCSNARCKMFNQAATTVYYMKVPCSFVDQTGNIERVSLFGDVAENFLKATAAEVMTMEKSEIDFLINSMIWQKYVVYLKVFQFRSNFGLANQSDNSADSTLRFNIIGCEPIDYEGAIKFVTSAAKSSRDLKSNLV